MTFDTNCKHAPLNKYAKHCRKSNEGKKSIKKVGDRDKVVGKGGFGCAKKCMFREVIA